MNATSLKADARASVVVFLVALPLALGIAIASGYPPVAGLITGVVGGIVVGMLGGSPLQVSGAAAGLTVLVFAGVERFGLPTMAVILVLAGLMQIAGAAARIGRWFQAVSPAVLQGMLTGIGVLIVAGQLHVMLDGAPRGSGLDNVGTILPALLSASTGGFAAFGIGATTIALMVLWPKLTRGTRLAVLPAPLVAVVGGALLAATSPWTIKMVDIPADLLSTWSAGWPDFGAVLDNPDILSFALQLALIASAESLLCAAALDRTHDGPRTQFDRELMAQGVGNALCGLLGALPLTGVAVRSAANVQAGAKTRLSSILHGVWLLLCVAFLASTLALIPKAALAGLLVYTGCKLINVKALRAQLSYGRSEAAICALTVVTVVGVDLLWGVALGLAAAGVRLLLSLSTLRLTTERCQDDDTVVVRLAGPATFLRLPQLAGTLESLPRAAKVELETHDLTVMDVACREHLEAWRKRYEAHGGIVRWPGAPASAG